MKPILKNALLVALLGFVGWHFARNLSQVDFSAVSLAPGWLALGIAFLLVHLLLLVACWKRIGSMLGVQQTFGFALMAWGFPLYGKYLPGRVARYFAVAAAYRKQGVAVQTAATMLGLELVASLAGFLLLTLLFSAFATHALDMEFRVMALCSVGAGLVALHPKFLNGALGLAKRVVKRDLSVVTGSYRAMLALVLAYVFAYVFLCLANECFLRAMGVSIGIANSSALFGFAALAGMFAVFAPSGLGAREAVLQLGLQAFVGGPTASVATLLSRVCMTLGELAFVALPAAVYFWGKHRVDTPQSGR